MLFTMKNKEGMLAIMENEHIIYTIEQDMEDGLFSVALKNPYDDEVLQFYQIKKWYTMLKFIKQKDLTIYESDDKIGEIHKHKLGYAILIYGVSYQLYAGYCGEKRIAYLYDRDTQIARFSMDEVSCVAFKNGQFGSLCSLLLYLLVNYLEINEFSKEAFMEYDKAIMI